MGVSKPAVVSDTAPMAEAAFSEEGKGGFQCGIGLFSLWSKDPPIHSKSKAGFLCHPSSCRTPFQCSGTIASEGRLLGWGPKRSALAATFPFPTSLGVVVRKMPMPTDTHIGIVSGPRIPDRESIAWPCNSGNENAKSA